MRAIADTSPLRYLLLIDYPTIMQLSTCLWGGFYNPIIPVSGTIPSVWKEPHFPDPSGLRLAKG